ncbi:MAG: hypothetical protein P4L51_03315 [Puia sp.]|nr:hypothetical protein [Puia sp.]
MNVYYGNFGRGNWAWPECLERHSIAVMDDLRVHPFWQSRDEDAYKAEAMRVLKGRNGKPASKRTATYWYNLNSVFMQTASDIWIHRAGDMVWWTISTDEEPETETIKKPDPSQADGPMIVYYKRCLPWSCQDKTARYLRWESIHAHARKFLASPGTFSKLSADNAEYALALIAGDDLSQWHRQRDWIAADPHYKERAPKKSSAEEIAKFRIEQAAKRMVQSAWDTTMQSGKTQISVAKLKHFGFPSKQAAQAYTVELIKKQGEHCALTGIKMLPEDDFTDHQRHFSLDRIDSAKHYEPRNLQVVCKFVNLWKSATDNNEFKRLIALVRANQQ